MQNRIRTVLSCSREAKQGFGEPGMSVTGVIQTPVIDIPGSPKPCSSKAYSTQVVPGVSEKLGAAQDHRRCYTKRV